ncbi:hypothetical protein [Photobacterium rosenbergii]|uniref:hypothetical protein n=1 Tax=Photobacterium rosenbergii TaxID=294936 RepID=UPI001C98E649|nr:hypothetical protein [Photobacterium rosenbergii]MBY5946829.1 hypothetical protein [Photobacterium rosenbergii]
MRQEWLLPSQIDEVSEINAEQTKQAVDCELDLLKSMIARVDELRSSILYSGDVQRRFQGYEEFRRHAVGKVVTVDTEKEGRKTFRVSQANSDFAMSNGNLATPLSPVGYLCRQAHLGFEGTSNLWGDYEVVEVRTLSRYYGQEAEDNIHNYKNLERKVFKDEYSTDENMFLVSNLVRSLKKWLRKSDNDLQEVAPLEQLEPETQAPAIEQTTFDSFDMFGGFDQGFEVAEDEDNWEDDYQSIAAMEDDEVDDYYGLSNFFYLNPTQEQLDVMTSSVTSGPMLIEGIAGSGKTCAALGRAKTLCDAALGADEQVIESTTFFSQESSVGFVRTGELVQYLKATCLELGLSHLPISEYKELQHELQKLRDVEQRPSRKAAEGQVLKPKYQYVTTLDYDTSSENTMDWLKMVDNYVGKAISAQLEMATSKIILPTNLHFTPQLTEADAQALVELYRNAYLQSASALADQLQRSSKTFQIDDIIQRIDAMLVRLEQQLLESNQGWVSLGSGKWQITHSRTQALTLLREAKGSFIRFNRMEKDKSKKQYFVISSQQDLENIIHLADVVNDREGNVVDVLNVEQHWFNCNQENKANSVGADFICFIEDKQFAIHAVHPEDIELYVLNDELFVWLDGRIKVAISQNPFKAKLLKGEPKEGEKTPRTTIGVEIRRRNRNAIFSKLHFADLYASALKYANDIGEDVNSAYERVYNKKLAEHDIDIILAIAHVMTRSADAENIRNLPPRLGKPTYYRSVFVDEVQDFTEIQIFLMGAQAHPEYHAVTMVGDMQQQLHYGNVKKIESCFPYHGSVDSMLLKENKRQERQPQLTATSHLFRGLVQVDKRLMSSLNIDELAKAASVGEAKYFVDLPFDLVDENILDVIQQQPRGRTIAVLCPTQQMASELEHRLRDSLASNDFRQSYVAERVDLSKKYLVHFSCPQNVKGLEFDTVIFAGLEQVNWQQSEEINRVYVALSRPRKQLVIMADSKVLPENVKEVLV